MLGTSALATTPVLELVLRVLVLLQCLLLFGLFARVRRADHLPAAGMLLCTSVMAFVISSIRGADAWLGPARWPLTAICVLKPALLWIFARAVFADRFRFAGRDVAALVGIAALGLWHEVATGAGQTDAAAFLATLLLDAATGVFILAVPITLWQEQRADFDPRRRRVRERILPLAVCYLALVTGWQFAAFLLHVRTPAPIVSLNLAALWLGGLATFLAFVRIDVVDWLGAASALPPQTLNANERAVRVRLERWMGQPRWYADASLSIASLARSLATNEQSLRTVISSGLGHRSFTDFLHHYRLAEATARLQLPGDERCSILSIALDAGFGSIGPFNRAFRARYGVTPSAFRRAAMVRAPVIPSSTPG